MKQAQKILANCNKSFEWKQINKGPHSFIWTNHKIKTIQVLKKEKTKGFPKSSAMSPRVGYEDISIIYPKHWDETSCF